MNWARRCLTSVIEPITMSERRIPYINNHDNYAWILLCLLSHGKIPLPSGYEVKDTAIPLWSGYQSLIAEKTLISYCAGYALIVDSKPSDMSTVYTVIQNAQNCHMHLVSNFQCKQWTSSCIIIRRPCDLVAFSHSVALFHHLVSSEVMVVYVILLLILVCMHLPDLGSLPFF